MKGEGTMTPERKAELLELVRKAKKAAADRFACMECGHKFRSAKAAERAYFGSGCPKCGGADFDEA